ncbi:MAG TPA: YlxR family protein [Thermoleophilia bacterium]
MTLVVAPERTCIGCRRKRGQAELVRLTAEGGNVVPARPGAPGRSAYLCPEKSCLEAAEKRRVFARAFRAPVTLDPAVRRAVARLTNVRCSCVAPHRSEPTAASDERR